MIGIGSSQISTSLDTVRAPTCRRRRRIGSNSAAISRPWTSDHSLQALDDPLQLIEVMRLEPATGDSLTQLARARVKHPTSGFRIWVGDVRGDHHRATVLPTLVHDRVELLQHPSVCFSAPRSSSTSRSTEHSRRKKPR